MSLIQFVPARHALLGQALADAELWHGDQKRKFSGAPYWVHPRQVSCLLARAGIEDIELLIAAMLHDVYEDTKFDILKVRSEIINRYGRRVHGIVYELTNDKEGATRAERMRREAERHAFISDDAKTVRCGDIISNLSDRQPEALSFMKVYVPEKIAVMNSIQSGADPVMVAWAWRAITEAKAWVSSQ